ncbi:MAG: hypothetical protein RL511_1249 [Bacteroidota bacterium]|jgi:hypothetical protein
MKKLLLLIIAMLVLLPAITAQNFPADRDKFVKTWQQLVLDDAAQPFLKDQLPQLIKGSTLNDTQFKKLQDNCNQLQAKEVPAYPDLFNFLQASIAIVQNKVNPDLVTPWSKYVFDYAASPDEQLTQFLDFSVDFFKYGAFYKERNYLWTYQGGSIRWLNGKKLFLEASGVTLKCIKFDENKQPEDSIVVYNTSGTFDMQTKRWEGKSGTLTWEKVKLPKNETFATLKSYKADFQTAQLKADSVSLSTPYFSTPILGKLTDKTALDLAEGEYAPQFSSYEKRLTIKDLRPQMDYDGGFTLEGADFIGKGAAGKPAKLLFKRESKVLFEISAAGFEMSPQQILARDASAVLRYKNGDSLSIQECFFTFDEQQQQLRLAAAQRGTDYFPFVDSYFKLYCYAPVLTWKKGTSDPYFTFDIGTAQERKMARFESMNYFDKALYSRFAVSGSSNPFVTFSQLVQKQGKTLFTEGELANALKKTIDQVKPLFVDLIAAGFLTADPVQKKILVTPKLLAYAAATQGSGDYDNLLIVTDLRKVKSPAYATIELEKQELLLRHVEQITLSEAQQVRIFPDTTLVYMYQNRDIGFSGWLKAGKCEVQTNFAKFDYEQFLVNLLTTKTTSFRVKPLRKEDGQESILVLNDIKELRGTLRIDAPGNKAGKSNDNSQYPLLSTVAPAKIFYNDPTILKGAYDSTRFYYEVALFELDSLDNFSEATFQLDGQLVSSGIFPKMQVPVRIMNDYSLGFITSAPAEGYPFYETNSRYKNQIYLSHNGLQGAGTIQFLHTTAISKKLTFLPDSAIGLVAFSAPEQKTGVRYPLAKSEKAYMSFEPRQDRLKIASYGDTPLLLFNEEVLLDGQLLLDKKAMTGKGTLFYKEAQLSARDFEFTDVDIRSQNAAFALRNRFSSYGENPLAIQSDEMKAHISFATRIGEFTSNGTKRIMFPANEYYCQMDKFTWFIDGESLDFKKNKGGETTFESGADLARNNFFSTNAKQDSLQFKSLSAKYDLKRQLILCDAVDYIQVGDARIFPDSSRVRVRKAAAMDTLNNAKVLANYITKYHNFEAATIHISGRLSYDGKGVYPYYDRDSTRSLIDIKSLSYVQTKTVAKGEIPEAALFRLSPEFAYFGKVQIEANHPGLLLEGSTKLEHPCQYNKSWMTFKDTILAKQIQIPIPDKPTDAKGNSLALGFVWRNTERSDSLRIYPAFLSQKVGVNDPSLFQVAGYLQYDQQTKQFEVGSKARLERTDSLSNLLVLSTENCSLAGYGHIALGVATSEVDIDLYGKISYDTENRRTRIAANAKISMPVDNTVWTEMANQLKAQEGVPEWNIKRPIDGLLNSLTAWSNPKDAQEVFKDFDEEKLKKMPNTLEQSLIISGIVLESFGSDKPNASKQGKGLLSQAQSVGLISLNGTAIAQPITLTQAYIQSFGDAASPAFYWSMEAFDGTRYIFGYAQEKRDGLLSIYATNVKMLAAIEAIKPDKRKTKNFDYTATQEQAASVILSKLRAYLLNK